MEKLANFLESHPWTRVLDALSKFGILVAAIIWVIEIPDRKERNEETKRQNIYRAWEVIALSELSAQSPARKMALEELLKYGMMPERTDIRDTPLDDAGFNMISFKGSYLNSITFYNSELKKSNFSYTYLEEVDFREADLLDANFYGATLIGVSFVGAKNIDSVDFTNSILLNVTGIGKSNQLPNEDVVSDIIDFAKQPGDWWSDKEIKEALEKFTDK
ncbi:pentapeptide repeat-containing protein [Vibrio antiquarius]|uniref:pentapeptide repeat-containing protein n=1 Tax=Vibrio antiquarius (strain Ex25) TaxID=150340 RepID=UPI00265A2E6E|nr:pentapeptide repeat-containing protein [Vibrio antiquarius]MCR9474941.1 pentapeptide repeat-containing protein [Vibrio antiquarius]